jgi:hypothetical protein
MNACADCRFQRNPYFARTRFCTHPAAIKHDPLEGDLMTTCKAMRRKTAPCGPVGMLWKRMRWWQKLPGAGT